MKSITQNILTYFEMPALGSGGKPKTGLVVDYEIHKCSDNSLLTSGTAAEIGVTGVYAFSYTFSVLAEYTLHWISPMNYKDAFWDLSVIAAAVSPATPGDITAAVAAINSNTDTDTADIATIKAKTDLIPDHPASVESTGGQIGAI